MGEPEVTRTGALDMQVCVPEGWSDDAIKAFADKSNECGTLNGWNIRKDQKLLDDAPYRNPCTQKLGFIHITLDA